MKNTKQEIISHDTPVFVQEEIENEFDNEIEPTWKEAITSAVIAIGMCCLIGGIPNA